MKGIPGLEPRVQAARYRNVRETALGCHILKCYGEIKVADSCYGHGESKILSDILLSPRPEAEAQSGEDF